MQQTKIEAGYFDRPQTKKMLWRILWGACALSVILEFFIHRKNHFPQEDFFGFYAVLGFAACSVCILVAKALGFFLKAKVDYYDDNL
jgi:hypothetical protein